MGIDVRGVRKTYSDGKQALAGIDLVIPDTVFGLLGPNGAGKSTLIRILAGLLEPTAGQVLVDGRPVVQGAARLEFQHRLGYLPQEFVPIGYLDPREYLEYCLDFYDRRSSRHQRRKRIAELIETVGLQHAARRRTASYSKGMQRRLGIAQALLHEPDILIVDEPTAGLDPEERVRFRNLIADIADERVVLLSTHLVADIEVLCTRIAVVDHGRVRYEGTPTALMERVADRTWERSLTEQQLGPFQSDHLVTAIGSEGELLRVRTIETAPDAGATPVEPTMEDAYMALVRSGA